MSTITPHSTVGFSPPPYPYDRLTALRKRAVQRFGDLVQGSTGIVDCSIGTPFDPPPDAVIEAEVSSGTGRVHPTARGSRAHRHTAAGGLSRRFGSVVDPERELASCVGTK